jgi:hypothetical protein
MKATKEQYEAFLEVRESGLTNMWDVAKVIELAHQVSGIKLTREECLDIIHHYSEYEKEYNNAT